jgi:C4-dicarboxylate-specific signal transduction histidine kinase
MTHGPRLFQELVYLLVGIIALAGVTGLYFWLDLPLVSAAFTYLIVVVLLSFVSSFPSLIALSFIAVGCLNYFFAPPVFTFHVDYPEDITAMAALLITSFIVTGLVRRLRAAHDKQTLASERLRDAQVQLAHIGRVTTMGQLSASIAHEVNQPISATVINAEAALRWLDRPEPDLDEVRQALACIVKDGNRAAEVISRIRDLIKKKPLRTDRFEINEAVREVIEFTHGEAAKNGVLVRTNLSDGLPLIEGDRVQLQQVILNLIINAVEAMSGIAEGLRKLVIRSGEAEHDGVFVEVQDFGPGLDTAALERAFEAFYTTKPGGLGMGLSICQSIIEAHGGSLRATGNVPHGAIFRFTVPTRRTVDDPLRLVVTRMQ